MDMNTYTQGDRIRNRHTLAEGVVDRVSADHCHVLWDSHGHFGEVQSVFRVFRTEIEPVPPSVAVAPNLSDIDRRYAARIDEWLMPGESATYGPGCVCVRDKLGRILYTGTLESVLQSRRAARLEIINAKLNYIIFKLDERTT